MGLPSPWIRGVTLFLYSTLLQETLLCTCRRKAILHILQMKSLKTGMSALFALFHTQMWDRRAHVLNTSGSFHTKLESRCPPQDISISITFACLLCCYMISASFFFLFPAFMWDFPSVLASPSLVLTVASRLFLNSLIMFYFPSLSLLSSTIKFSKD